MNIRSLALSMVLITGLIGCNSSGSTNATAVQSMQQAALAACQLYIGSLQIVTTLAPRLSPSQIATVNSVRTILNPLCSAPTPAEGAATTIMTEVTKLLGVQSAVQGAR